MLELLVGRGGGDEQAFAVAGRETAYYAGAGDGGVADGDHVLQFCFEDGVEVFRGADGDEGVGVCEGGEDADSVNRSMVSMDMLNVVLLCEWYFSAHMAGCLPYSLEFSNDARTAMIAVLTAILR